MINEKLILTKEKLINSRYLSLVAVGLFIFLFLFNYGFYLFAYPIPGFSNDAIQYFYAAFKILDGDLPITDLPVDIPLGYPLFLSFFLKLKLDIIVVVYVQILIMFISSLFLVIEVGKNHKLGGLLFSVLMGLWICDPNIMNHNTYFYPDSLFGSSIVLTVLFYLRYLRKRDLVSLIGIAFLVVIGTFIRSNGFYLFFIIIIVIYELFMEKSFRKAALFFNVFVAFILCLSSVNYYFKSSFFPGDLNRISFVINGLLAQKSEKLSPTNNENTFYVYNRPNRFVIFKDYLLNMTHNRPAFYYSQLNYNKLKYANIKHTLDSNKKENNDYEHFRSAENESLNISEITRRIFGNHDYVNYNDPKINGVIDYYYRPRNFIVFITHGIYSSAYYVAYKFAVPSILFVLITIICLIKLLSNLKMNKNWWPILIISLFHWGSIFILTFGHHRVQSRYIIVSEFVMYLTIVLGGIQLVRKKDIFAKS